MGFWQFLAIAAVSIIIGMTVALRMSSGRPINFNVDSHAEAHGGSATSYPAHSSVSSSSSPSGSSGLGIVKWIAIAAIGIFMLMMAAGILNKINAPSTPVVVNVPTAPPPVVITVIPPTAIPKLVPSPVEIPAPVTAPVPSEIPIPVLVGLIPIFTAIIVGSVYILRKLRTKPIVVIDALPMLNPGQPIQYRRTSYGWTPVASANPENVIENGDVLVDNFFSKSKRP